MLKNLVNGKVLIFLLLICNGVYFAMVGYTIPMLLSYTNGLPIFDMRPMGYSYAETVTLLDSLGPMGIEYYITTQLALDWIYPACFMLTYSIGILWVYKKLATGARIARIGALIAVLAGLFDYLENIHLYKILSSYPKIDEDFIFSSNITTILKSGATTVAMSIFLLGLIRWCFVSLMAKKKG
tara:strand:- start:27 stop:575 length:549 start_codon:yes stop_codon:yes gene_type:complete